MHSGPFWPVDASRPLRGDRRVTDQCGAEGKRQSSKGYFAVQIDNWILREIVGRLGSLVSEKEPLPATSEMNE